jgi:hypothetical protein
MNKRFLTLVGVATVLSVGTYFGLTLLKPHVREEAKVADVTPADQVFSASVSNPETTGAAAPAAETAAPAEMATTVAPADTAVQPAADTASAAPAAADPAAEPAAAAPAATQTATAEPAAAAPAPVEPAAPAAEPAAAPAEAAAPVEKPKKSTHMKSAPGTTTAHKAGGSPAPVTTAHKGDSSPTAVSKVWWPTENAGKLSLVYAGQASFKKAIVLLFNGAFFKPDSVNANLKVTDKNGKAISGRWELGENNRRMVVFPVAAAGTYKVSVGAGLTDNKGRKLGARLGGPVQIH